MPYRIYEKNGKHCVGKKGSTKPMKCYPDRAQALRYFRALEINVQDARSFDPSKMAAPKLQVKAADAISMPGELDILGVPFYGHDNGKDSYGQFFSPRTNLLRDFPPLLPSIWYYHGNLLGKGSALPLGVAQSRWSDEHGEWFRVVLDLTDPLQERLWQAALRGDLYGSSGVIPASRVVAEDGEVLQWQVGELSLIEADAEQQMAPANFYAIGIPHLREHLNALDDEGLVRAASVYSRRSKMPKWLQDLQQGLAQFQETVRAAAASAAEDDEEDSEPDGTPMSRRGTIRSDGGCECGGSAMAAPVALAAAAPVEDPRVTELQTQLATMRTQQYATEDGNWISQQVREGRITPAETSRYAQMFAAARAVNATHPEMLDHVRASVMERPVNPLLPSPTAIAGFDSTLQTGTDGNRIETAQQSVDEDTLARMRRMNAIADGQQGGGRNATR